MEADGMWEHMPNLSGCQILENKNKNINIWELVSKTYLRPRNERGSSLGQETQTIFLSLPPLSRAHSLLYELVNAHSNVFLCSLKKHHEFLKYIYNHPWKRMKHIKWYQNVVVVYVNSNSLCISYFLSIMNIRA